MRKLRNRSIHRDRSRGKKTVLDRECISVNDEGDLTSFEIEEDGAITELAVESKGFVGETSVAIFVNDLIKWDKPSVNGNIEASSLNIPVSRGNQVDITLSEWKGLESAKIKVVIYRRARMRQNPTYRREDR